MNVEDSGELVRRLNALGELFDVTLSPAKKALYFEALRDLPFDAIATALNAAVKTCTFMPRPAEIRKLAIGDVDDAIETAWMALRAAMQSAGAYRSIATTDPALGEAIVALFGSWPEACATDLSPEMWSSKRKEFGRVYRVLCDRALTGTRYLPGIVEQQNGGRLDWTKYTDVTLIGAQGELRELKDAEAEPFRTRIVASAYGFKQFADAMPAIPGAEETA